MNSVAPSGPLRVAILGTESSGKSTLAAALAARYNTLWVPEYLREFVDTAGRLPVADDQFPIAATQAAREDAAAAVVAGMGGRFLFCDTTPLMTAVYSEQIFGNTTLYADAAAFQRTLQLNLVMALDLPWVADGIQRDGAHVRAPVDRLLRQQLHAQGLDFSVVRGLGASRLESALNAITPLLLTHRPAAPARAGLFQRLLQRESDLPQANRWTCELCDDAACEHAVRQPR